MLVLSFGFKLVVDCFVAFVTKGKIGKDLRSSQLMNASQIKSLFTFSDVNLQCLYNESSVIMRSSRTLVLDL